MNFETGFRGQFDSVVDLYTKEGWSNYTCNPEKLRRAWDNSNPVVSVWIDDKLVGFIRCITDGESILYIQDIIVDSEHRRLGIGKKLIDYVLNMYPDIRQCILISDNSDKLKIFYNSCGFSNAGDDVINGYYLFR